WPSRSPDLNPCDFWLWGYLKDVVFSTPIVDSHGDPAYQKNGLKQKGSPGRKGTPRARRRTAGPSPTGKIYRVKSSQLQALPVTWAVFNYIRNF
ncbi:hypothetical protein AVEN_85675-1, partial [Araneus ventricosus]